MQSPIAPNLTPVSRQEALLLWKTRTGQTYERLGGSIGLSGNAVSKLLGQETMPTHRHRQLLALGVPEELLPRPLDLKPGPKPRTVHDEFAAAYRG